MIEKIIDLKNFEAFKKGRTMSGNQKEEEESFAFFLWIMKFHGDNQQMWRRKNTRYLTSEQQ